MCPITKNLLLVVLGPCFLLAQGASDAPEQPVAAEAADVAIETLHQHQITAAKIGRVLPKGSTLLSVT